MLVMADKKKLLVLLLPATMCLCSIANAAVTELLPNSSYYEGKSYFSSTVDGGLLSGRIDFAVYDTTTYANEFIGTDDYTNPGSGRYIYAYQIFCDADATTALAYFGILNPDTGGAGIDGDSVLDYQDDGSGGISPDSASIDLSSTYGKMGVWTFDGGYLVADENSYFLVLSSNQDWIVGGYTFDQTLADGLPIAGDGDDPPTGVPEPGTIALLGIGAMLFRKRKNSTTY